MRRYTEHAPHSTMNRQEPRPSPPDSCLLERYLKIVSGIWAPKIIWFLRFGPRHFGELRRDLGSVSTKVLSAQLRSLCKEDLIARRVTQASLTRVEYSLTARGKAFGVVFKAMEQFVKKLARLDSSTHRESGLRHCVSGNRQVRAVKQAPPAPIDQSYGLTANHRRRQRLVDASTSARASSMRSGHTR